MRSDRGKNYASIFNYFGYRVAVNKISHVRKYASRWYTPQRLSMNNFMDNDGFIIIQIRARVWHYCVLQFY